MSKDQAVLDALKTIVVPDLKRDIVSLGFVKDLTVSSGGDVSFSIHLSAQAMPIKDLLKRRCEDVVTALPWVSSVLVMMTDPPRGGSNPLLASAPGLQRVQSILAVSSCKGGVGKSTVAVNLAFTLARMGHKVGIFDADVYGPSLPTMVAPSQPDVYAEDDMILPLEYEGVKLMSFGFVSQPAGGGPAIMRGPMVTQVINQLLTTTKWGELDYLVIDFPPGTGDIQLTLTQLIPITAALIVTTPQQLSFVDVVKGIQMFDKLKVPTIGVVENMSYYECPKCGERQYLFGRGAREKLEKQFGIRNAFDVPILPAISEYGDSGKPIVLAEPDGKVGKLYATIGAAVASEVQRVREGALARPRVSYVAGRGIVLAMANGVEKVISPADLRRKCRCAHCIEEFSGRQLLKPEDVKESIFPTGFQPMGNYAMAIQWSDGHNSSIYPYDVLIESAR